jgi:hypothetical protein
MITKRRVVNTPADLVALIGLVGDKTMEVFGIILLDKNQRFMGLNELEDDGQTTPALQAALVGQADSPSSSSAFGRPGSRSDRNRVMRKRRRLIRS